MTDSNPEVLINDPQLLAEELDRSVRIAEEATGELRSSDEIISDAVEVFRDSLEKHATELMIYRVAELRVLARTLGWTTETYLLFMTQTNQSLITKNEEALSPLEWVLTGQNYNKVFNLVQETQI